MKRISSRTHTLIFKLVLPLALFAVPVLCVYLVVIEFRHEMARSLGALGLATLVELMFLKDYRKIYRYLADDVLDGGDFLLIRVSGAEARIDLAEIFEIETSYVDDLWGAHAILHLPRYREFGRKVVFFPIESYMYHPIASEPGVERLRRRVDLARLEKR